MADKNKGDPQRGGESKSVTILLPADLVEQVDKLAEESLRSRSKQIEKIIKEALPSEETAPARR